MTLIRRVLTSFREDEQAEAQMFQKDDGTFWLRAADGTETQVGSGGGGATQRAQYGGDSVAIADGADDFIPWSPYYGNAGETPLLDLSDPKHPTVVTTGVYAITAVPAVIDPMTVGGFFQATIRLDAAGDDGAGFVAYSFPSTIQNLQSLNTPLPITYYISAGAIVECEVANQDGGGKTIRFALDACSVQRVS